MALGERHVPYELWVSPRGVRRRSPFPAVVAVCWGLALLALAGGGAVWMNLFLLGGAALILHFVVGGIRRQVEGERERASLAARAEPRPCVVLKWFGSTEDARRDCRSSHPASGR
jgi:hypothetical protein